jgi:hypothetical protein
MKAKILWLMGMVLAINVSAQKLEKLWTSSADFVTPESVLYDPDTEICFVSNMGTEKDTKTEDGFISLMNLDGEIENLKWVTGLRDPKGMAVHGGRLYVADMDELVVIDISAACFVTKFKKPNAKFLNDVTVASDGIVYVSDMRDQRIYALINGDLSSWLNDPRLDNVNGLWAENGVLYAGNTSVWEINHETKEMKEIVTGCGGIDGLETIGDGRFIFSNWGGKIYVSNDSTSVLLIDNSEAKLNTADIDYLPTSNRVLVPTFFGNTIDCYQLILNKEN